MAKFEEIKQIKLTVKKVEIIFEYTEADTVGRLAMKHILHGSL
jgi:hypothetical protein